MTRDDDFLHVQMSHCILQDCVGVKICCRDEIPQVAMNKYLTRTQSHDLIIWNAAIGASEVEVARLLGTSDLVYIPIIQLSKRSVI